MNSIQRTGGTAGIVAAALFVVLLATTFTYDPAAYSDPAKALEFAARQQGLRTVVGLAGVLAAVALVLFYAGLANRLRERTPARAQATYNFGVIGAVGLALGSLTDWLGIAYLVGYAAKDATAAQHAWVALTTVDIGFYGLAGLSLGISTIVAGWAVAQSGALRPATGWIAVVAGVIAFVATVAQAFVPPSSSVVFMAYLITGLLFLAWFGLAGSELRRMHAAVAMRRT